MRFSELDGARIGVWGAGREIISFAEQLSRRLPAAEIVAAAFDAPPPDGVLDALRAPHARVLSPAEAPAGMADCEVVVRSPGVPTRRPELAALRQAGVEVTTATALWLAERGGAGILGVTGTKGKSTTAALIAHLAKAGGHSVELAGNIGLPALDLLDRERAQITVLELSSYQVADLETGPEVALLTNLFREHTDWHGSEEAYRADKLRLLDLPGVRKAVLNGSDERLAALRPKVDVSLFGVPAGWEVLDGGGVGFAGEPMVAGEDLPLRGRHNALNVCGALAALEAFGMPVVSPAESLKGFRSLPHRLQSVTERDGVLWVNDSISTTPESALAALASFAGRELVLIAGGQDRGQDYGELARTLVAMQVSVVGVPSTGPRLLAAAREAGMPQEHAIEADGLEEAVAAARSRVAPGGVVLLSPAAPSYDHFRDFEQRGEHFAELVLAL